MIVARQDGGLLVLDRDVLQAELVARRRPQLEVQLGKALIGQAEIAS